MLTLCLKYWCSFAVVVEKMLKIAKKITNATLHTYIEVFLRV